MDVLPWKPRILAKRNLAGLDWLRALAALGVVALHACVPYASHPMPGLAWPVSDGSSELVNLFFWAIEIFIMPLFLLIAGFLAFDSLRRRRGFALVVHRGKRLLIPFCFGMLIVLPLDLHIWVLGWVLDEKVPLTKLRSFKFDGVIDKDLWGTSHLWFLQYLFTYICLLAAGDALFKRIPKFRFPIESIDRSINRWIVGLAALGSIVLVIRPEVVWGFQHSFWPVPSKWLYSGLFFAMGGVFATFDPDFTWLSRRSARAWTPGVMMAIAAFAIGRWHLVGEGNRTADVALAFLTCGAATLLVFAMIGTSISKAKSVPVAIQYLAAASFWVYIIHHPLVALIHIDLQLLMPNANTTLKAVLSFGLASSLALLTYEGLVRTTRIGRWLGFQWSFPIVEPAAVPTVRATPVDERVRAA